MFQRNARFLTTLIWIAGRLPREQSQTGSFPWVAHTSRSGSLLPVSVEAGRPARVSSALGTALVTAPASFPNWGTEAPHPLNLAACILFLLCSNPGIGSCFVLPGSWGHAGHRFHSCGHRRRRQVARLHGEIRQLQHSGISSASAEALIDRMLNKIEELCAERDRLKKEQPSPNRGKALGGRQS